MSEARTAAAAAAAAGKYLTFALAQEEYGLLVIKVREIIKIMSITAVPQVPDHVKGVINLRGKVIPIIDLRLKFGLADQAYTERTCIIVAEVEIDGRKLMLGVIVDSVSEVLNIAPDEIEPAPDFGERLETGYMQGIAKIKGKVKILLDLDRVLASDGVFAKAA
jgi:purine-binding chemotaxis protein CheW